MVKQTVKSLLILVFWLCVAVPCVLCQTYISSANVLVAVDYQANDSCSYQHSDSVRIIFKTGFEGEIEMRKSGKTLDTFSAYYNKSLEMVPHIFTLSIHDLKKISFQFDNRESIEFDIAENFGVLYISRNANRIPEKIVWSLSYNNCFFPGRR